VSIADYYQVLQVSPGADAAAIQAAYRALCKQYHPDTGREGASVEMMRSINEAYAVLADAARRQEYDAEYHRAVIGAYRTNPLRAGERSLALGVGLALALARVPAGAFLMGGCTAGGRAGTRAGGPAEAETEPYSVELPEYYIGLYPVTVAQYAAFADATGRRSTPWARRSLSYDPSELGDPETITRLDRNWRHPFGERSHVRGKPDHPVMVVTWYDAVAFCEWAGERSGATVRLPSAAEWQKAARGVDGRCYPWGNEPAAHPRLCNCRPDWRKVALVGDTTPVGSLSPAGDSPYGCADMLGNVWEWTATLSRDRDGRRADGAGALRPSSRPDDGPADPNPRAARRLMGGSFQTECNLVNCAAERDQEPLRAQDTGFRVCVTA
jgi:formylglycine-generating enzyme